MAQNPDPSQTAPSAPTLEDLIDFPAVFTFRAMCAAADDSQRMCTSAVESTLSRSLDRLDSRPSKNQRFLAVHLTATVQTADEIRAVYAALRALPQVRLVL